MRSAYFSLAVALHWAGEAVAQNSNPLDGFISQAASIATQLAPSTTPSSQSSQTSSSASRASSNSETPSFTSSASSATSNTASPTSAASQSAAPAAGGDGGLSPREKGIIAGSVVAGVLLLAILVALLCCCCLRRRRRRRREKKDWEKRGLHKSDEHLDRHREAYANGNRHHGNFSSVMATPRQSSAALPRHSGASDRGLIGGTPYDHHGHPMPEANSLGTAHGGVLAAASTPRHSSGALPRHSETNERSSRNPFAAFAGMHHGHKHRDQHEYHNPHDHYDHDHDHDHRMSGGSGPAPPYGDHPAFRNSTGSNIAGGAITDPSSPASMNSGVKRRPVPDEHHHGAALGAGAVGAAAGAAAYKHHHDKKRGSGVSNGDYIEDNNRYSTGSASSGAAARRSQEAARRSQEAPPPLPYQHDASRFPPLLPTNNGMHNGAHHSPAPLPTENDEYRPPTPFGLAALGSHSPHRSSHGSPPAYPETAYPDPPFAATRRSGSFPDATVSDHSHQYPGHHVTGEPRRSSRGSSGALVPGAAGVAAGAGAAAIAGHHAGRRSGSFPSTPVDDHQSQHPYHHGAEPHRVSHGSNGPMASGATAPIAAGAAAIAGHHAGRRSGSFPNTPVDDHHNDHPYHHGADPRRASHGSNGPMAAGAVGSNPAFRRSGSFPDPAVGEHNPDYPYEHEAEPRRSSHGSNGPMAAGPAAPMAAGAIGGTPAFHRSGSFPDATVGDHSREYPYHHTAAPPTKAQRRSLQEREFTSGGDSGEYIAYNPDERSSKRYSMPDNYERSRSNSAPRVPPAAVGAVGRDSPRVMATEEPLLAGSGHGHGHGNGYAAVPSDDPSHHLPRPAYPGQQTYGSYYSDAPTPGDEIPGAFPREGDRPARPVGPGMRDEGRRSGNGSPARSGRKLRFSDRHEEWEFADEDRPQDAGVGRAL